MERIAKITIEVGILLCSQVRNFLNKCKFDGMDINFIESSGFISKEFYIKGKEIDILKIKNLSILGCNQTNRNFFNFFRYKMVLINIFSIFILDKTII